MLKGLLPYLWPSLAGGVSAASTPWLACGSPPGTGEKNKFSHNARGRMASIGSAKRLKRRDPHRREMDMALAPNPPEKMMFQLSLRRRGISDQAVLRAMEDVPREAFVEMADRADAYRDSALGIACGQTISQPFVVAYMTEQLNVQRSH